MKLEVWFGNIAFLSRGYKKKGIKYFYQQYKLIYKVFWKWSLNKNNRECGSTLSYIGHISEIYPARFQHKCSGSRLFPFLNILKVSIYSRNFLKKQEDKILYKAKSGIRHRFNVLSKDSMIYQTMLMTILMYKIYLICCTESDNNLGIGRKFITRPGNIKHYVKK